MKNTTKKITTAAILLVLSLLAFMVENLFPPPFAFAPYIKLGFSNIFILYSLFVLDLKYSYLILILKCLISGLFSGVFSIYFSLPSGLASLTLCVLLFAKGGQKLSICGASGLASSLFNSVQLLLASIIAKSPTILYYLPISLLIGYATGIIVGYIVFLLNKYIKIKFA